MSIYPVFIVVSVYFLVNLATQIEGRSAETLIKLPRAISQELERSLSNGRHHHAPCTTKNSNWTDGDLKNGIRANRYRWSTFTVYVDPSYSDSERSLMNDAMAQLQEATPCINFRMIPKGQRRPSGDYVHIIKEDGCWSLVGKQGGRQEMSIDPDGCMYLGTIMHEMIHALGFDHEHSRADRDDFITIRWENVEDDNKDQFDKVTNREYSAFGVRYNTKSIMHYDSYSFSKNRKPTMVTKNGGLIGENEELQQTDIDKLKKMYNC